LPKSVTHKIRERMLMKVEIDVDLCTGCGLCEETCPDIFKLNEDDDVAEIIKKDYDENDEECIEEAIESCPTEAITTD
jgi:ferredoxin